MKVRIIAVLSASMLLFAACSSDPESSGGDDAGDDDGSGGSTSTATTGSGSDTGTSTSGTGGSSSSGGGADVCTQFFGGIGAPEVCSSCLADQCCTQYETCLGDAACAACVDGDDATACDGSSPALAPLQQCMDTPSCTQDQTGLICGNAVCDSGLILVFSQKECADCLGTSCCDAYTACSADQACLDCITGQAADPAACDANELLNAISTCEGASCGTTCVSEICNSGLQTGSPECNVCLEGACCNELTACANDADCMACITGDKTAADPACANSELLNAANTCWTSNCGTQC